MAKTLTQLTIFISGPGDTDAEKAALRRVIEELNRRLEKTHGVTLRVVGWPDDVRPGVNTDLQAEVNRQIGAKYDIYVGVLGPRFGTATPRAGSGTEEELSAAVQLFRSDPSALRVLFYFKRAVEDPFTLDLVQLQKVKTFREALAGRGVLFRDFGDTGEFVTLVNDHLYGLIVDEWREDRWTPVPLESPSEGTADSGAPPRGASPTLATPPAADVEGVMPAMAFAEQPLGEEDDLGLLEYMAAFQAASEAANLALSEISSHTERIGERIRARTSETELLQQEHKRVERVGGSRSQQEFVRKARDVVDGAASDLEEFVSSMTPAVGAYRAAGREMFANFRRALDEGGAVPGDPETAKGNRRALEGLIQAMETSRTSTMSFQVSVQQIPALTGKFKRARQQTAAVLGSIIAELSLGIDEGRELLRRLGGDTAA